MRGGTRGVSGALLALGMQGAVELSLLVRPALTFALEKQNVRFGHFSSLGTWDVLCVIINSMPSTLPGPGVSELIPCGYNTIY